MDLPEHNDRIQTPERLDVQPSSDVEEVENSAQLDVNSMENISSNSSNDLTVEIINNPSNPEIESGQIAQEIIQNQNTQDTTPRPTRTFSLRSRASLRNPRRPLDENFVFAPQSAMNRCSTPIKNLSDVSADETMFSTPKESITPNGSNLSENLIEPIASTSSSSHICPDMTRQNGKETSIAKLTDSQLIEIAKKLKIHMEGDRHLFRAKIDEYYKTNHPTWPRNSRGFLMFPVPITISEPTALSKLTKDHLLKIFEHFHLDTPSALKTKRTILALLENELSRCFPAAERDIDGSLILTSEILQTSLNK